MLIASHHLQDFLAVIRRWQQCVGIILIFVMEVSFNDNCKKIVPQLTAHNNATGAMQLCPTIWAPTKFPAMPLLLTYDITTNMTSNSMQQA